MLYRDAANANAELSTSSLTYKLQWEDALGREEGYKKDQDEFK